MIIERKRSNSYSDSLVISDINAIISYFNSAVKESECEVAIPLAAWLDLEVDNSTLSSLLEISNPENVNISDFYHGAQILSNTGGSYTEPLGDESQLFKNKKRNDCYSCSGSPIKINIDASIGKIDLKNMISIKLDNLSFLFSSDVENVCVLGSVFRDACIEDIIKIIGTLVISLQNIMKSINIESPSISQFLNGLVSASISNPLKNMISVKGISLSKSTCLSDMLNRMISEMPTNSEIEELDRYRRLLKDKVLKMEHLPDRVIAAINAGSASEVNRGLNGLKRINSIIDNSIESVGQYLNNLSALSIFPSCENNRETGGISNIVKNAAEIISTIKSLLSILKIKTNKKCSNQDETLSVDDILKIVDDIAKIKEVEDNGGEPIKLIVDTDNSSYIDSFSCKLVPEIIDEIERLSNAVRDTGNNATSRNLYPGEYVKPTGINHDKKLLSKIPKNREIRIYPVYSNVEDSDYYIPLTTTIDIISELKEFYNISQNTGRVDQGSERRPIELISENKIEKDKKSSSIENKDITKSVDSVINELNALKNLSYLKQGDKKIGCKD